LGDGAVNFYQCYGRGHEFRRTAPRFGNGAQDQILKIAVARNRPEILDANNQYVPGRSRVLDSERASNYVQRTRGVSLAAKRLRQVSERIVAAGRERNCTLVIRDRLAEPAELRVHVRAMGYGIDVLRLGPQGSVEAGDGGFVSFETGQQQTSVA